MLELIKRLFPFFMSSKPPKIYSLFPRSNDDIDIFYWCSRILGLDVEVASTCLLRQLDHCKVDRAPQHEFLKARLTLASKGAKFDIHMVIHRTPAPIVEVDPDAPKTGTNLDDISYVSSVYHLVSIPISFLEVIGTYVRHPREGSSSASE